MYAEAMPHLQLEYGGDVAEKGELKSILEELVAKAGTFDTVASKALKAYVRESPVWTTGEGHPPGFVHLTFCVLEGRSIDLLGQMADGLYEVLKSRFATSVDRGSVALSLEVRLMMASTYRK